MGLRTEPADYSNDVNLFSRFSHKLEISLFQLLNNNNSEISRKFIYFNHSILIFGSYHCNGRVNIWELQFDHSTRYTGWFLTRIRNFRQWFVRSFERNDRYLSINNYRKFFLDQLKIQLFGLLCYLHNRLRFRRKYHLIMLYLQSSCSWFPIELGLNEHLITNFNQIGLRIFTIICKWLPVFLLLQRKRSNSGHMFVIPLFLKTPPHIISK